MRLYLNGQDIKELVLADIDDEKSLFTHSGEPETFLAAIEDFLLARKKSVKDIETIYLIIGPGSATSLRTIVTIANVLALTQNLELFGLLKVKDEQDIDSVRAIQEDTAEFVQKGERLLPIYENTPQITKSTRDSLKRKLK